MNERYESKFEKLFEMANLDTQDTGLNHGTIFVSTHMASHAPRIKYYRTRAGEDKPYTSISLSAKPEIYKDYLGITQQEKKEVFAFVKFNFRKLIKFWNEGNSWTRQEVSTFLDGLKKI